MEVRVNESIKDPKWHYLQEIQAQNTQPKRAAAVPNTTPIKTTVFLTTITSNEPSKTKRKT